MFDDFVNQVIARLKAASEFVTDKREKLSRQAGLEGVRKAREHALVHPHMSATPLPEALDRAENALARLEREAGPLVKNAAVALLAVEQAAREVKSVKTAIDNKRASERSAAAVGLYQEAVKLIDKLSKYGAKKWVLRQQSDVEARIFADLMRWKARDHEHEDPNSPWHLVFDAYRDRQMDVEVDPAERYGTSMPQHVADAKLAKRLASTPATLDLSIMPVIAEDQGVTVDDAEVASVLAETTFSIADLPTDLSSPANEESSAAPSAGGIVSADEATSPPAIPMIAETAIPSDSFDEVALAIAGRDGVEQALWQEVGFPNRSSEYDEIVRNGEAAITRGSVTPHLVEFVEAARKQYPNAFLADLRKERAERLAKILAADPNERARFRAQGFNVPEN